MMQRRRATARFGGMIGVLVLLSMLGCEEDVAAPSGLESPYSIYGIVNPRLPTQTLLVSPIDTRLTDYPAGIDAAVVSTDLNTGETITWQDSIATGERGQVDHVFTADFRPSFGRDYRVTVTRSDGATTSAEVHVPELVEVAADTDSEGNLDIVVTGAAFHLLRFDVIYEFHVYMRNSAGCAGDSLFLSRNMLAHAFERGGDEVRTGEGYRLRIDLEWDHHQLERQYNRNPAAWGLALMGMGVRLIVAEEAWDPPGGVFDERTLADRDVMTNTINGFGLVAGGYNHERSVYPPEDVIVRTRFLDGFVRPPRGDCTTYCKCIGF